MSIIKTLIAAAILLAIIAGVIWFAQEIEIDRCLDQGGRWNYTEKICEDTEHQGKPSQMSAGHG